MGLFDTAAQLVRRLPAGELPARAIELSGRGLAAVEAAALRLLADRMLASTPKRPELSSPSPRRDPDTSPEGVMSALLSRSLQSDTASSRADYHLALLRQLVPDEARILAALAAGPPAPLVTIYRRGSSDVVLENASLVGRTAAVTVPSLTPRYVTNLHRLGLVEFGPEDENGKQGYELVLAERDSRAALKAGELGKLPARVERRTVRLSAHGRELWAATSGRGDA
jgi:hypothetical protein